MTFDLLAGVGYTPPMLEDAGSARPPLPQAMRILDGRSVEIDGIVVPVKIEGGVVSALYLCNELWSGGLMPENWSNEIYIELEASNVLHSLPRERVTFRGTLRVKEVFGLKGDLAYVYALTDAEALGFSSANTP